MRKLAALAILLAFTLTPAYSFAYKRDKEQVPLLSDYDLPQFKHMKVHKQYRVTSQFMKGKQLVQLAKAAEAWNGIVGKDFVVITDDKPNIHISQVPLFPGLEGIALPYRDSECSVMLSEVGAADYRIIMHELGHCFGLAHQDELPRNEGKIMHPRPHGIMKFQSIDSPTRKYLRKARKKKDL